MLPWRLLYQLEKSRLLRYGLHLYTTLDNLLVQVSVSKFHELRYNVTYVLKEMEDLEKRNILKIGD